MVKVPLYSPKRNLTSVIAGDCGCSDWWSECSCVMRADYRIGKVPRSSAKHMIYGV